MILSMKQTILMKRYSNIKRFMFYAAECCQAIILELNELVDCQSLKIDKKILEDKRNSVLDWHSSFVNLNHDLDVAKIKSNNMLILEDTDITQFKSVPLIHKEKLPNIFRMAELFYQIGYYSLVNDPVGFQNKSVGVAQKLSAIRQLELYLSQILKGLNSVKYIGAWKVVGTKIEKLSKEILSSISEDISLLIK